MNKFLWILGGTSLGLAAYVLLNQQAAQSVPVDGVDATANRIGTWGTKQRAFGTGGQLKGKVEQGAGELTDSADLADKGAFDEAKGVVKDAAGQAAHAVEQTIHELNK